MGYLEDRQWADQYLPQLKQVVGSLLPQVASFRLDVKEATDLIVCKVKNGPRVGQPVGAIAARVRRPGNFWQRSFNSSVWWGLQFTIRSLLSSGVETEMVKIMNGFGDWFVYGHIEQTQLRHWMVLDLEVFRQCANDQFIHCEKQDNGDGTFFNAYDVTSFPPNIFIGASQTIKFAIEHGVAAVERLPSLLKPRRLRPAPDLQALVAKFGGYDRITADAWAEFYRAVERYRDDMRNGCLEIEDEDREIASRA